MKYIFKYIFFIIFFIIAATHLNTFARYENEKKSSFHTACIFSGLAALGLLATVTTSIFDKPTNQKNSTTLANYDKEKPSFYCLDLPSNEEKPIRVNEIDISETNNWTKAQILFRLITACAGVAIAMYYYSLPPPCNGIERTKIAESVCRNIIIDDLKIPRSLLKSNQPLGKGIGYHVDRDGLEFSCYLDNNQLNPTCDNTCIGNIWGKMNSHTEEHLRFKTHYHKPSWLFTLVPRERFSTRFGECFPEQKAELLDQFEEIPIRVMPPRKY